MMTAAFSCFLVLFAVSAVLGQSGVKLELVDTELNLNTRKVVVEGDLAIVVAEGPDILRGDFISLALFNGVTGKLQKVVQPQGKPEQSLIGSIATNSSLLALTHHRTKLDVNDAAEVSLFDIETMELVRTLAPAEFTTDGLFGFALSMDERFLCVSDFSDRDIGGVSVFDVLTGEERYVLRPSIEMGVSGFGLRLAVSEGRALITGRVVKRQVTPSKPDNIFLTFLYNLESGEMIRLLTVTDVGVRGIAMHRDVGVVSETSDEGGGSVSVFDVTTGERRYELSNDSIPEEWIYGKAVEVDDRYVVVTAQGRMAYTDRPQAWGGAVFVYDVKDGALLARHELVERDKPHEFGNSVGLSDDYVIVGAKGTGGAYVFPLPHVPAIEGPNELDAPVP